MKLQKLFIEMYHDGIVKEIKEKEVRRERDCCYHWHFFMLLAVQIQDEGSWPGVGIRLWLLGEHLATGKCD